MYGETGAAMRIEFAALLRQHRVQQRLAGATREAREELGVLIRTYRQTVLSWLPGVDFHPGPKPPLTPTGLRPM